MVKRNKKSKVLEWVTFVIGIIVVVSLTVFWFKANLPTHILVSILGGLAVICALKICYDDCKHTNSYENK